MQAREILFAENRRALAVSVASFEDLDEARVRLNLVQSQPVLILVGGAAGIARQHEIVIEKTIFHLAGLSEKMQWLVLDGATHAGIIALMGKARASGAHAFALLGVAVETLVSLPGASSNPAGFPLNPNHTHFLLVPGREWGDESPWIMATAKSIACDRPCVTILLNGGEISRMDVEYSIQAGIPVVIVQGTGRLANELASAAPHPMKHIVSAHNLTAISTTLLKLLN